MVAATTRSTALRYSDGAHLRNRLVLSTLSGRAVRFDNIRSSSITPGLSPAEVSFVRLLDKLTNGSSIEISDTGTTLRYRPGVLVGPASRRTTHTCHPSRALAYYLEPLLMLGPFCKHGLDITLRGPTTGAHDASADSVVSVAVPLLRRLTLGAEVSPEAAVLRRGAASGESVYGGGAAGAVVFKCGVVKAKIAPVELMEAGLVKRVRGIAFANRVSPTYVSQMVDGVRGGLNAYTPDVYVHTDHANDVQGGAGYGVALVAETTEGCLLGADWAAVEVGGSAGNVATCAVNMLLEQAAQGGCVDAHSGCLALLMCALSDSDVSRVRLGRLTDSTVAFLRDLKSFFGVTFKVTVDEGVYDSDSESGSEDEIEGENGNEGQSDGQKEPVSGGIVMSCVGIGHINAARQRF